MPCALPPKTPPCWRRWPCICGAALRPNRCRPFPNFHLTAVSRTNVQVVENGSVLFPALERATAWQVLLQEGLARLNAACRLGAVFHAGAVCDSRGGVILCGASGCGKSTLTAYLLTRGFGYLSDEVILWQSAQGQIRGFARSLVLKPGAAFLWQGQAQDRAERLTFADGSAWLEPRAFSPQAICRQTRPRLLLFPQYRAEAPPLRVRPLSPAESLFRPAAKPGERPQPARAGDAGRCRTGAPGAGLRHRIRQPGGRARMDSDALSQTYRLMGVCARAWPHPHVQAALQAALERFAAWETLPAQAERHGMGPLLWHHLRERSLPPAVRRTLQGLYLRDRALNQIHAAALCRLLETLERQGIRPLVLKGLALAWQAYPDPALRPVSDIDLFLRQEEVHPAIQALQQAGYRFDPFPARLPKGISAYAPPQQGISTHIEFRTTTTRPTARSGENTPDDEILRPARNAAATGHCRLPGVHPSLHDTLLYLMRALVPPVHDARPTARLRSSGWPTSSTWSRCTPNAGLAGAPRARPAL